MTKTQFFIATLFVIIIFISWKGFSLYRATLPTPIAMWSAENKHNQQTIDHDLWQEILTKYVRINTNGTHAFDYNNVSNNDRNKLTHYLVQLQKIDPRDYRKDEQLAYWVNMYNALIVDLVLTYYPVKSVKEIGDGYSGPWNINLAEVANTQLSLNNIEHGILRPLWQDMRIHYVINCASVGCPDLSDKALSSTDINQQLNSAAIRFINQAKGVFVDGDSLILSSIYDWFSVDFGSNQQALITHLMAYASPELKQQLAAFNGTTEFAYDWKLNDVSAGLHISNNITTTSQISF